MSVRWVIVMMLTLATVVCAIAVVWSRHQHRQAFIELSRLQRERDELNIDFGRLQIEQATWSEANRIEQIAIDKLRMRFPSDDEVVVISR